MQEQLRKRLAELREEFAKGKNRMEALETEATELRQTLLRISGAIQVLQEELDKAEAQPQDTVSFPADNGHAQEKD